jgi:hypothetical protein
MLQIALERLWNMVMTQAIMMEFFIVFVSPSRQSLGQYLKLGYTYFLPHPFQFIIHKFSYHSVLYSLEFLSLKKERKKVSK